MTHPTPAVHRTIVAVDVAGFTDPLRRLPDQLAVRQGMYEVLKTAFARSDVDFDSCEHEDRGDGALILVPPTVSKSTIADRLPGRLAAALQRYNSTSAPQAQLKLLVALHYGDIRNDGSGWIGNAVNHAFRILDAPEAKAALAESGPMAALISSDPFYINVIEQDPGTEPESYRQIVLSAKNFTGKVWLRLLVLNMATDPPLTYDDHEALVKRQDADSSSTAWEVQTRGYGDRPPDMDLLRRSAMIGALADLISPSSTDKEHDRSGPTVIALDGPWGIGKTSLVNLIRKQLFATPPLTVPPEPASPLRAFEADRALSGRDISLWRPSMMAHAGPDGGDQPPLIAAHFEPWAHQTSEQVWAGLTATLLGSVEESLLPKRQPATDRYWFQRNIERVDRVRLRRSLRKGILSPMLAPSALALAVPLIAQMARSTDTYRLAWVDIAGSNIAVIISMCLFLLVLAHSAVRYFTRPAAHFLPEELFVGPVPSGISDDALRDPFRNARSGYLYLAQHDVFDVLEDVKISGHHMVVFVDDLDRCTPRATAEVFEAVNLFVTRTFPITRFVLCLDTATVATHLDDVYASLKNTNLHGDDPSPGWSFLRKLIQLPVTIPYIAPDQVSALLDNLLGDVKPDNSQLTTVATGTTDPVAAEQEKIPTSAMKAEPDVAALTEKIENDSSVRQRIRERLENQRSISVREAKRILTIWQYYIRVLIRIDPQATLAEQARHLVILAEIVARWPASQRTLHSRMSGEHGLQHLARATNDDWTWALAVRHLGLHTAEHRGCANDVRELLQEYDGESVAALAAQLT